jgi:thiol:disulfide interchange protein
MKNLLKISIAIFLIAFTSSTIYAQETGVKFFKGTWNELLEKAKAEKKPFFVDIYAVWCGPCKWMSKNTFTNAQVGEYANQNYIAYKLDGEKGEGPTIAQKYKLEAYPTILFFSSEGNLVGTQVGAQDSEAFINTMKKYKDKK